MFDMRPLHRGDPSQAKACSARSRTSLQVVQASAPLTLFRAMAVQVLKCGSDRAGTAAKRVPGRDSIMRGKGIGRPRRALTIPVQAASADASRAKFLE